MCPRPHDTLIADNTGAFDHGILAYPATSTNGNRGFDAR
jgi:hypothetical protein